MADQGIAQGHRVRIIGDNSLIMVVGDIEDRKTAECHFVGKDGAPQMARLPLSVLERVDPD